MTRHVSSPEQPERAVLVAVGGPVATSDGVAWSADELMEELRALSVSAGAEIVGELTQARDRIDARLYIGRGKAEELEREVAAKGAQLVIFDNDLTPAQGKNLEDLVGVRVLDRQPAKERRRLRVAVPVPREGLHPREPDRGCRISPRQVPDGS